MQPRGCPIRGEPYAHQSIQSGSVRWAVSPLFVKQIKFILKFELKRSSHRHSNHAFAICTTSLALWNANFCNLQGKGKTKMGILNIKLKLQWNKLKGNDLWSEL